MECSEMNCEKVAICSLRATIDESISLIKNLRHKLENSKSLDEFESLQHRLHEKAQEVARLESENARLNAQQHESQSAVQTMQQSLDDFYAVAKRTANELRGALQMLGADNKTLAEVDALGKLSLRSHEPADVKRFLDKYSHALSKACARFGEFFEAESERRLVESTSELANTIEQLNAERETLLKETSDMEQELNGFRAQVKEMIEFSDRCKTDLAYYAAVFNRLSSVLQLSEEDDDNEKLMESVSALVNERDKLHNRVASMLESMEKRERYHEAAEQKRDEQQAALDNVQLENQNLQYELDKIKEVLNKLEMKYLQQQEEILQLRKPLLEEIVDSANDLSDRLHMPHECMCDCEDYTEYNLSGDFGSRGLIGRFIDKIVGFGHKRHRSYERADEGSKKFRACEYTVSDPNTSEAEFCDVSYSAEQAAATGDEEQPARSPAPRSPRARLSQRSEPGAAAEPAAAVSSADAPPTIVTSGVRSAAQPETVSLQVDEGQAAGAAKAKPGARGAGKTKRKIK